MRKLYILAALVLATQALSAQIISTIAGTGTPAYSGDGGAATLAQINNPRGVAVDAIGNVYFTDFDNHRIRKVDTFGVITTIAGTGTSGFTGDGGLATNAQIQGPLGIACDAAGNVYFTDGNNAVRKVNVTTGIITRYAGMGGMFTYSGDGGPATAAELGMPWGVAFDAAGNLYLADTYNQRIRKVTPGGIISTICGNGILGWGGDGGPALMANMNYPLAVATDGAGNVYVADNGNNRVKKISPSGILTTICSGPTFGFTGDGGPATAAKLYYPKGLACDAAGNIYICDYNNNRIRKINTAGIINTIVGTGAAAYSGDGGAPTAAAINQMTGVAVGANGNIYISDNDNHRIRAIKLPQGVHFTNGHVVTREVCQSEELHLDTLLNADDMTMGQPLNWTIISVPAHGSLGATTYSGTSVGGTATPAFSHFPFGYLGLDSLTAVVADGSGHTDTMKLYLNIVGPLFPGIITATRDTVCAGDTLNLGGIVVAGGTWNSSAASTATVSSGGVVTGVATGSVTISYTVSNVCGPSTAMHDLYVRMPKDCPNAVGMAGKGRLTLVPNPNSGEFVLHVPNGVGQEAVFEIFDMLGRKVMREAVGARKALEIKLSQAAGMYFIRMYDAGRVWEERLNVEKQ